MIITGTDGATILLALLAIITVTILLTQEH
jgi:hypothetical protein